MDWDLIRNHLRGMLRVAVSIKSGRITPSTILRRLETDSRKNKLYLAFRELGRVVRTGFLQANLVANPSFSLQPGGPIEYDRHGSRLGSFRNPVDENPGSVRRNVVLPVGAFEERDFEKSGGNP